jgi:hypothetical protein
VDVQPAETCNGTQGAKWNALAPASVLNWCGDWAGGTGMTRGMGSMGGSVGKLEVWEIGKTPTSLTKRARTPVWTKMEEKNWEIEQQHHSTIARTLHTY